MCFKKKKVNDVKPDLSSVEDLLLNGVCEDCDQDPMDCWLKDFCAYGHTEEVLRNE